MPLLKFLVSPEMVWQLDLIFLGPFPLNYSNSTTSAKSLNMLVRSAPTTSMSGRSRKSYSLLSKVPSFEHFKANSH